MSLLPQFRVRTAYTFKEHKLDRAFGTPKEYAKALSDKGCHMAAIVDYNSYGHRKWQDELLSRNITPIFGLQLAEEEEAEEKCFSFVRKPFAISNNPKSLYRWANSRNPDFDSFIWNAPDDIVVFCGNDIEKIGLYNKIDLSPSCHWKYAELMKLEDYTFDDLKSIFILVSDNDKPSNAFASAAETFNRKAEQGNKSILSSYAELREAFFYMSDEDFEIAYKNTFELKDRLSESPQLLPTAPIIQIEGDLLAKVKQGFEMRFGEPLDCVNGELKVYQNRVKKELEIINQKRFDSYFLVVEDLVKWAKNTMLVGTARGSAAGSLICYLLGITEIDPIKYNLIFERFINVNRDDLPDIDIDFPSEGLPRVFEYLSQKYGEQNVSRIGSVNEMKVKTLFNTYSRFLGLTPAHTFDLQDSIIEPEKGDLLYGKSIKYTAENTKKGQDFFSTYPQFETLFDLENQPSHAGVHAAGILVCNEPITDFCIVENGVAQVDKKDAESLGLLKLDALGLRTLSVLTEFQNVIGEDVDFYSLEPNDAKVFDTLNEGRLSGIFQFEGKAIKQIVNDVCVNNFEALDHITALGRPGPMSADAHKEYAKRSAHQGKDSLRSINDFIFAPEQIKNILGETYGLILYQEQIMRICSEYAGMDAKTVSNLRKLIGDRKGEEALQKYKYDFLTGAQKVNYDFFLAIEKKLDGAFLHRQACDKISEKLWQSMVGFGSYGMNKSHTVSYAMISYWCLYCKTYWPLEYGLACLRLAKDRKQEIATLKEIVAEGFNYIPFDLERSQLNWSLCKETNSIVGGFQQLVGVGIAKAAAWQTKKLNGFNDKEMSQLLEMQPEIPTLTPIQDKFKHIFSDPESYGVYDEIDFLKTDELTNFQNLLLIVRVNKVEQRDENEPDRIARRGGKISSSQTQFLNLRCSDDFSDDEILFRVNRKRWYQIAEPLLESLSEEQIKNGFFALVRGKWLSEYSMVTVTKVRILS